MWEIKRYSKEKAEEWNEFVSTSRNSTFLFLREYMDYHSDRFTDMSLMAYRNGKLSALLPANISGLTLHSHQGLTYGGWILPPSGLDTSEIFHLWRCWLEYCKSRAIQKIEYKPLPYIYATAPSQEDLYMLFLSHASLIRTDISTAIDLQHNPGFNKLQKRHLRKGEDSFYWLLVLPEEKDIMNEFHVMLRLCLKERHGAVPVHSPEELELLISRFPDNILVWALYSNEDDRMVAAVCVYETNLCAHCQYIATTEEGRTLNALPVLFQEIIRFYCGKGYRYLDFGISNEAEGRRLNAGLNRQKTSFGGSGVTYQRFEINVVSALESLPNELWPEE